MRWYDNDFHLWLRHPWKLLPNHLTRVKKSLFTPTHTLFYISLTMWRCQKHSTQLRSNSNAIFTRAAVMVYAAKLPSCAGSCLFCISCWLIEILANYSDPYANIPSLGMGEMHDFLIGTWFTVGDMGKIDNNRKITTKQNLVSWDFHHIWRTTCYQSNMCSHICIYMYFCVEVANAMCIVHESHV